MHDNNQLVAFYGSLRKGMPLYEQFKHGLEYSFSLWVQGYQLFSLGEFPCAVKSMNKEDKMLIEFFRITNSKVEREIDDIEIGYGYYRDWLEVDGSTALIYLFLNAENYPRVLSGDWVKFFRSRE